MNTTCLKIYFKNVKHGDSIILEWNDEQGPQIGIIDCNLVVRPGGEPKNPVLEHLTKREDIQRIKFIILTHPHKDHYSGFLQLFEHCESRVIHIENFIHTASFGEKIVDVLFDDKMPVDRKELKNLENLYGKIISYQDQAVPLIKNYFSLFGPYSLKLSKDIELRFKSPFAKEFSRYLNTAWKRKEDQFIRGNNPNANLLSTLIEIAFGESTVLLTSDVTTFTFERLLKQNNKNKFNAFQIPHHGSINNFHRPFWESQNIESSECVISAGGKYHHPHSDVVKFFTGSTKTVHSTNFVCGYATYQIKEIDDFVLDSNSFNIPQKEQQACGEKVFHFNYDGTFVVDTIC